jgi:acetyltransferase-like isoleucine patch superfamily enzyme
VASDVTVLRGVSIGEHSIIGARSVVTKSIPPHSFAVGAPAKVVGRVGDRSRAR